MAKLHFYRTVGGHTTKFADGTGNVSATQEFTTDITHGTVKKGTVYQIRQGQSPNGDLYNCLAGASTGETARFKKDDNVLAIADEEFYGASLALQKALAATQKSVTIEIAEEDLKTLKSSDYKLCFAKKIAQGDYNVVWQSSTKYLVSNSFSWTPQYELFGSNLFQENIEVKVATNIVNIGLGETSILNEHGILEPAKTGGPDTELTMDNQYDLIHPGVNQLSTGITGETISTPIYVAPNPIVKGLTSLTPVEKVLVWFEQNIATGTMFSQSRSLSVEIDLTNTDSATRLYSDQKWITP